MTLRQAHGELTLRTDGPGLYEITDRIDGWARAQGIADGLLTLFIRHTSASLLIQENADPDVQRDLHDFFRSLVPEDGDFRHRSEGPDDMPAHIKGALTQTHLAVPLRRGRPALGTWQGIFLFEHRNRPHDRTIALHLSGE
ncbi:MAG: secondary thiamine-phosphate synthase enzyme YjbQ [Alphaproteobacteria bacterium]|jgi:secondary thiamine-phosphate synthase enzyme|nr:secondary thiamine-phosphate synthase enzyme YjbQ [Alphaproteobacteria bacterium]MDP6566526.1 secondary thiamine-phosphate synthase enzyme YjbQ [Alphaproteobacteria bacterium]MDP6815776.1 secondary thiamine-phosphate synthase enzyme YjbQ [Alphaproteobacteria bacterium]